MSEGVPAPDKKNGLPRWVGVVLLCSLGLNLFLGGLMVPWVFADKHDREHEGSPPPPIPAAVFDALKDESRNLPQAQREALRDLMKREFLAARPKIQEIRQARKDVFDAMGADPYDPEALEAAFLEADDAMLALAQTAQDVILKALAQMTPEQRQAVVENLRRGPGKHLERQKGFKDGQRGPEERGPGGGPGEDGPKDGFGPGAPGMTPPTPPQEGPKHDEPAGRSWD